MNLSSIAGIPVAALGGDRIANFTTAAASVTRGWRAMSLGAALVLPVVFAPPIFLDFIYATATVGSLPEEARAFAALVTSDQWVMTVLHALMLVAWFAHVNALVFRGGMIRLLGLEFVTTDGRLASRLRVLSRTAVIWVPLMIVALASSPPHWLSYACLLLLVAGAISQSSVPSAGFRIKSPARGSSRVDDTSAGSTNKPSDAAFTP